MQWTITARQISKASVARQRRRGGGYISNGIMTKLFIRYSQEDENELHYYSDRSVVDWGTHTSNKFILCYP